MIELHNLTIANNPRRPLLSDASLTLPRGTLTALIGRNGCGKSTLLRTLAGAQKPQAGSVSIDGTDVASATPRRLARLIAAVGTEAVKIENLTCRELVGLARSPYTGLSGRLGADDREAVDRALGAVGMREFAERDSSALSDGESRRILLARALAQATPVILLDEPTSFLDVPGRYEVCELLARLAHEEGKTIVYSTHELEPAFGNADLIALMGPHGLTALPPDQMKALPEFQELFRY